MQQQQQQPESPVPRETSPFVSQQTQESSLSGNSSSDIKGKSDYILKLKIKGLSGKIVAKINLSKTVHRFGSAGDKLEIRLRLREVRPIHGALFADSKGVFVYPFDDSLIYVLHRDGTKEQITSSGRRMLPCEVLEIAGLKFLFELEGKPVGDDLWGTCSHPVPPEEFCRDIQQEFCSTYGLNIDDFINKNKTKPSETTSKDEKESKEDDKPQVSIPEPVKPTVVSLPEPKRDEPKIQKQTEKKDKPVVEERTVIKPQPVNSQETNSQKEVNKNPLRIPPSTSPKLERFVPFSSVTGPTIIEPSMTKPLRSGGLWKPTPSQVRRDSGSLFLDGSNSAMGRQEKQETIPYCTSPARGQTKSSKMVLPLGIKEPSEHKETEPHKKTPRKTRQTNKERVEQFVRETLQEKERRQMEVLESVLPQGDFNGYDSGDSLKDKHEDDSDVKMSEEHKPEKKDKKKKKTKDGDDDLMSFVVKEPSTPPKKESHQKKSNGSKGHKEPEMIDDVEDELADDEDFLMSEESNDDVKPKSSHHKKDHSHKPKSSHTSSKTDKKESELMEKTPETVTETIPKTEEQTIEREVKTPPRRKSKGKEDTDYLMEGLPRGVGGTRRKPLHPEEDEAVPHKKMSLSREFDLLSGNLRL